MAVSERAHSPDADLGSLEFWGRPAEERDRCFARMRREEPLSRHQPPEDILGLPQQERLSYWAVVRYDDVRRISRDPATFCSCSRWVQAFGTRVSPYLNTRTPEHLNTRI